MVLDPANGVAKGEDGRKPFPVATPSWTLAQRPRSKHEDDLLAAYNKLGQLPLLTVYVVPV
jgi:hypothetical protein